ncbi:hypothetical protein JYK04_07361 [Streptomyces nojiriensis]|nr:hypothetical protein JYK04_07361 [Streptomyces nojiriensis]
MTQIRKDFENMGQLLAAPSGEQPKSSDRRHGRAAGPGRPGRQGAVGEDLPGGPGPAAPGPRRLPERAAHPRQPRRRPAVPVPGTGRTTADADGAVPSPGSKQADRADSPAGAGRADIDTDMFGVILPEAPVVERVDPLVLEADELALLELLGPPLPVSTPRAVKRLANSYGLLTAIRHDHPPRHFLGGVPHLPQATAEPEGQPLVQHRRPEHDCCPGPGVAGPARRTGDDRCECGQASPAPARTALRLG